MTTIAAHPLCKNDIKRALRICATSKIHTYNIRMLKFGDLTRGKIHLWDFL